MNLTQYHKQSLIEELKKALAEKETMRFLLESESAKDSLQFCEWTEIRDYLNNRKIQIIEEALCDIEIDY